MGCEYHYGCSWFICNLSITFFNYSYFLQVVTETMPLGALESSPVIVMLPQIYAVRPVGNSRSLDKQVIIVYNLVFWPCKDLDKVQSCNGTTPVILYNFLEKLSLFQTFQSKIEW